MLANNFPVVSGAELPNQLGGGHGRKDRHAQSARSNQRWRSVRTSGQLEKERILDELCAVTGRHRQHAIRALLGSAVPRPRGRSYGAFIHVALIVLWDASDRLCSKRRSSRWSRSCFRSAVQLIAHLVSSCCGRSEVSGDLRPSLANEVCQDRLLWTSLMDSKQRPWSLALAVARRGYDTPRRLGSIPVNAVGAPQHVNGEIDLCGMHTLARPHLKWKARDAPRCQVLQRRRKSSWFACRCRETRRRHQLL